MKSLIPPDIWETKRMLITRLYKDEEWPLKQVIKSIQTMDFRPSESQLRSRLKKWHITKPSRKKYSGHRKSSHGMRNHSKYTNPSHMVQSFILRSSNAVQEPKPPYPATPKGVLPYSTNNSSSLSSERQWFSPEASNVQESPPVSSMSGSPIIIPPSPESYQVQSEQRDYHTTPSVSYTSLPMALSYHAKEEYIPPQTASNVVSQMTYDIQDATTLSATYFTPVDFSEKGLLSSAYQGDGDRNNSPSRNQCVRLTLDQCQPYLVYHSMSMLGIEEGLPRGSHSSPGEYVGENLSYRDSDSTRESAALMATPWEEGKGPQERRDGITMYQAKRHLVQESLDPSMYTFENGDLKCWEVNSEPLTTQADTSATLFNEIHA